jgi:hypothetical protein
MNRDEFYKKHVKCPQCKSSSTLQTLIGVIEFIGKDFIDEVNTFECSICGCKGKIIELVE